ncbi:MAG: mobile mystery protein A [Acidimicrobiales bacterium]
MINTRRTARRRLDQRLVGLDLGQTPPRGWIRAIREALGMSTRELGRRMGLTQSRVSQIERAEELGSLRLETLDRAARALNCQVRYVFVPHEPLEDMVRRQARRRAEAEVDVVTHTMALEDQAPEPDVIRAQVEELTERFIDDRNLWAEPATRTRR